MNSIVNTNDLSKLLGKTDMYLIDLIQKGYFDKSLRILDAGCGSGRNLFLFAELGHQLFGLDQNKDSINKLNDLIEQNPKYSDSIKLGVGEMDQMNLPDNNFDLVICNAVLHFAKDINHFEKMIAEMVRVVKQNGVLFLRLVTSHTMAISEGPFNREMKIKDGTNRFVVDEKWLKQLLEIKLNLSYLEEFKTVNIDNKRTMTTLVLHAK